MANYANSLLVTAQASLSDRMKAPEFRNKVWSVNEVFKKGTPFILPDINSLKTSDQRSVKAYTGAKTTATVGSARAHDHSASGFGDSQEVSLSFTTYARKFKVSLKMADRNFLSAAEMLANEIQSTFIDIHDEIESDSVAYLGTNKTQVNNANSGTQIGSWDGTNYEWEVAATNEDYYFQYIASMMRQNKYRGMMDVIHDPVLFSLAQQKAAQGATNAENLGFQFAGLNQYESIDLSGGDGQKGISYVIPTGTVGMIDWIPRINREGRETKDFTYTTISDPFGSGLQFALHIREDGADNSSNGAEVQDVDIEYEVSTDIARVKAPLSTSNASTIFKSALLV